MLLLQNLVSRIRTVVLVASTPTPHHPHSHMLHLLRFISIIPKESNFTVDYLINTCGLSPESALKASKRVNLKSPTKPDSVLSLLKNFDIPKTHISKLVTCYPRVLLADPNKNLKPKLQLLSDIGMSGPALGRFLSNNTTPSLENQIIPCIKFFKGFFHSHSDIVKVLSRLKWIGEVESIMGPNIAVLRDHGITESGISKLMIDSPQRLCVKPDRFKETVLELEKMGFTHSENVFVDGLNVRLGLKKPTWDAKLAAYNNFGWSDNEVLSMFKRQPFIMAISEKKINLVMNFLMNNLNWTLVDVTRIPSVLMYSLEKRVIPRSYVLLTLLSKGLISKAIVHTTFVQTEDVFVKRFVTKYHHDVPDLLELYQRKMGTQDQRLLIRSENE